jgi:hypothetical protein
MTIFLRAITICVFVAIGLVLIGCGQSNNPPELGHASLEYLETSGADLVFKLANGSPRAVAFDGSYRLSGSAEPSPSVTAMECWVAQSAVSDEEPFALVDGPSQAVVRVLPAEQVRLFVPSAFALQHKGGRCRLRLRTQDGPVIESGDFEP